MSEIGGYSKALGRNILKTSSNQTSEAPTIEDIKKNLECAFGRPIEFRCGPECNLHVYMCYGKSLQSIKPALWSENIKSPQSQDMWIIADVLEFVVGNPQTAEHPRLNLDENTQSQDSFQMVCMTVAGLVLCLF